MTIIKPNPKLQPDKKPRSVSLSQAEERLRVHRMKTAKLNKVDHLEEKCLVREVELIRLKNKTNDQDNEIKLLREGVGRAKMELETVEMDLKLKIVEEVFKKDEEIKRLKITHEAEIQKEKETYTHHLYISHKRLDQVKSLERDKEKYIKDIEDLKCVLGDRTKELEDERGETNKHRKISHGRWGTIKSLQSQLDISVGELERLNIKLSGQDRVLKEVREELGNCEALLKEKKGIIEFQESIITSQKSEITKLQPHSSTVDIPLHQLEEIQILAQERLDAVKSLEEKCTSQSNEIDQLKSEIITANTASGGAKEELRRVQEISNWRYGIITAQQQIIQGQGEEIEELKLELDFLRQDKGQEGSCTSEQEDEDEMECCSEGNITEEQLVIVQ